MKEKESTIRVTGAKPNRPTDNTAMKKIARAVIAIAARQVQQEASPDTFQPPSPEEEKR